MSLNCKNGKRLKTQIHCPVSGCLYSAGSERHFTEKKNLNQHFAKVHAEKKYSCSKCKKSFGLDGLRKYHEKTCGIEWKCSCGGKYTHRESLLTHARRNQHQLPDYVLSSDKMKQCKMGVKSVDNPIIVVIQPIIQNLTCIQPVQTSVANPRPILPKLTRPVTLTLPMTMQNVPSPINPASSASQSSENFIFKSLQPLSTSDEQIMTRTNHILHAQNYCNGKIIENDQKIIQKSIGTQTADELISSNKPRQSRASQCTRRIPKGQDVGIESTHTQTAESVVVKIKKKRSRRKSVAITTESNMLTNQNMDTAQSLWPGVKDFILQHADSLPMKSYKNSASTQTNTSNGNKVLCDSETITDGELFKFHWGTSIKGKDSNESCSSPFEILSNITADDTLVTLPEDLDRNNLPELNIFSNNSIIEGSFNSEIKTHNKESSIFEEPPVQKHIDRKNYVFSMFEDVSKSEIENKVSPPTLSDIHTQTITSTVLDYNLLANMETQTTDDFNFSDLEFSDTETQTPWEDFPNIDDSPLQTDSIEIQTDFPSFPTGFSPDPYEFINSMDMQNIIGLNTKETPGINTETQTLDKFSFPQLTNTESQTLDISDFMFESLGS